MSVKDEIETIVADATGDKPGRVARLKSLRLRQALPSLPLVFTAGQMSVTVSKAAIVNGNISLTLALTRNGVSIPLNNPFVFVNPPILVPDAAGTISIGGAALPDGTKTAVVMHREDPIAAMKAVLIDTLRVVT